MSCRRWIDRHQLVYAHAVEKVSVLLVEDEPRTRRRLVRVVEDAAALHLVGAAEDVASARKLLATTSPDVLLTDLGLPDGSGVDPIRELRRSHPDAQAMVVTVFGDERTVMAAIEAGATGYLLKDGTDDEIAEAILELVAGGSPISASIARHLLRRFQARAPGLEAPENEPDPSFTPREHEVLGLVAKGFSAPEIARLFGLSPHTVKTHIRHIYKKLEVTFRGEAVYQAVRRGLLRDA